MAKAIRAVLRQIVFLVMLVEYYAMGIVSGFTAAGQIAFFPRHIYYLPSVRGKFYPVKRYTGN
jgi:hypothetical protein